MNKFDQILKWTARFFIILLVPLLLTNLFLIYQSYAQPDRAPNAFGITPLIVQSGSMDDGSKRAIKVGDLMLVKNKTQQEKYHNQDVITFKSGNSYVSHEVITIKVDDGITTYQTKGRANNAPDQEFVKENQILGKNLKTIPKLGDFLLFLQTPLGLVGSIGIPILLLMGYDRVKEIRAKRQYKGGTEIEEC
ncbi:signal peptidase I [Enterococcus sp. CSURQ0835]|uniref:signal peptidase I n=1 Tax=Enterococcus sp. CSURQ0835 TaxID=2681394 RepID=UPI00135966F9|nr:signal peptidase I [Enterococcus sp. CSURQ0835]